MKIEELTDSVVAFRDARNWKQFHTSKDMLLSLSIEVAELTEHFQWKSEDEIKEYLQEEREQVGNELADVLYWVLLLGHDLGIDLSAAFTRKMQQNEAKYPVEKSRGSAAKYDKL
ncbi:MAG: nucleotide pyrophosphohydrolase [Deltaproteobacteria bacterium]|nr:nucleotide pyrophosphohydrolase [Deltaproteobacteria bacterium]